ncbi:ubiquinol-cytochrome-c reductase complex assembly factor 2 isoform X1 [Eptesicus fuscus]|uniref:ubiquinol-cytochrome-c reductase complex assembly factor 2 isoform X1 n=1 Tax=Eptesicus fuscus TaxID=29078 RepID=UPI002403EB21|nr:ubiquinol-cytochrome-c reductase complex assembly factor 2 isoform X1 [Eptesicus fuscus]
MAAGRYRRFLKLCEEWPVDETKRGRDLGAYLRQRVAQAFREGENTQLRSSSRDARDLVRCECKIRSFKACTQDVSPSACTVMRQMYTQTQECSCWRPWVAEPEACDEMYESLARLHSNYYKHKYPRPRDTSFSGLTLEEYKLVLSTDALGELKDMNKGLWKKLQEKFSARSPEEKQKVWAQSLSRPRT